MPVNLKQLELISEKLLKYKNCDLMIVTKNQSIEDINFLIKKEFYLFGENKVQEAKKKFTSINNDKIQLHLIGPLQTNKVKLALSLFDAIQSLDREKLVLAISKELNKNHFSYKTKEFFIQVNIGKEKQKSGVLPSDVLDLYKLAHRERLHVTGLMCIPPNNHPVEKYFKIMNEIKNKINKHLKLSMGMSNDFQDALRCNSNLVRIGSKIFS